MAEPITARQQEILNYIRASISMSGIPPTRAEIADHFGFASSNAAEQHLRALARYGRIKIVPGASRGIVLTGAAPATSGEVHEHAEMLRARTVMATLAHLDKCCKSCTFDTEGEILRHCDRCVRKIIGTLSLLRRQYTKLARQMRIAEKEAA